MEPMFDQNGVQLLVGDCRAVLREMAAESVQCCVTSPPYYGLRSYLPDGDPAKSSEIGAEPSPAKYVAALVRVFRAVRRVLAADGTLWLNLGDSFVSTGGHTDAAVNHRREHTSRAFRIRTGACAMPPKNLLGMPWRVAFALQADGWWLRQDIIWAKPNPMPESVRDRCTRSHEYLFQFAKSPRYFYDHAAIREAAESGPVRYSRSRQPPPGQRPQGAFTARGKNEKRSEHHVAGLNARSDAAEAAGKVGEGRNKRDVWTLAPEPFPEAHFAVMPTALALPCILAGSRSGDTVLDPFSGAGTVALVAHDRGRRAVGIDLNPAYAEIAARRIGEAMRQARLSLGGGVGHG